EGGHGISPASPGVLHALELHRDRPHRIVLAQREAVPVLRHEDAAQVGMTRELDPEHVVDLALEALGAGGAAHGDGPLGSPAGTCPRRRRRSWVSSASNPTTTSNRSGATPGGSGRG